MWNVSPLGLCSGEEEEVYAFSWCPRRVPKSTLPFINIRFRCWFSSSPSQSLTRPARPNLISWFWWLFAREGHKFSEVEEVEWETTRIKSILQTPSPKDSMRSPFSYFPILLSPKINTTFRGGEFRLGEVWGNNRCWFLSAFWTRTYFNFDNPTAAVKYHHIVLEATEVRGRRGRNGTIKMDETEVKGGGSPPFFRDYVWE